METRSNATGGHAIAKARSVTRAVAQAMAVSSKLVPLIGRSRMRHLATFVSLIFVLPICAQTATQAPSPPETPVLRVSTELVVIDVVVEDKSGNPVHGLTQKDFELVEGKVPQNVRHFEEHSTLNPPAPGPAFPRMPPGTYTDYTPVAPTGTLNILLLDALNTPMKDQSFVRSQLQDYLKHADPGTRIAIFGLSSSLVMLQGFTSDPETLKRVVNHKLIPQSSQLLDDPVSGGDVTQLSDTVDTSMPGMAELAANMQQFEAQMSAAQMTLRAQYTLDAFNALAHYLSAFPGRKNLIWFSGSFPLNILPDPNLNDPFNIPSLNEEEFRETTNLLTKSQVAVYPVDARGLMTAPAFSASNSGAKYAKNPTAFSADASKFASSQDAEHGTMNQLAEETGGQAFYNTNGLAEAVEKAVRQGSNYYTLTYTPTNRKHDGGFRDVHISLTPAALNASKSGPLQLSYRRGYYDQDPNRVAREPADTHNGSTASERSAKSLSAETAYARNAMARGAPTPEDLLFEVRVLPASTTTETTVANGNVQTPLAPAKGPFRRFGVDYAALPADLTFAQQPDRSRTGEIAFLIDVYDRDGNLLNTAARDFKLAIKPEFYAAFIKTPFQCHLEISVPDRVETYIRVGVEDVPSSRFGVVEIPSADIAHLPPPVYPAPSTPPKSTAPPTAPSTNTTPPAEFR
jgi:VWFA-related protein